MSSAPLDSPKRRRKGRRRGGGAAPSRDALMTLLVECDAAAEALSTSVPVLASHTVDFLGRCADSSKHAAAQAASSRSALLARKRRVLGCAKRMLRKQDKRIDADFESVDVSSEQLRDWAAVAGATSDLVCAFLPLLKPHLRLQTCIVGTGSNCSQPLNFGGELGSVATCAGLRATSAVGPGLKWFEPHTRNVFSVVLALADGSSPTLECLIRADIAVVAALAAVGAPTLAIIGTAAAGVQSESMRLGTVIAMYGGLPEDVSEVVLQLTVCGVIVADAVGGGDWSVLVPRRGSPGHKCAALGTYVGALAVVEGMKSGMAVSADDKWLVVGLSNECTLLVYSLPGGDLVRTFGGHGDGPLQFNGLRRLCFAPNGNLVVADERNKRLQEVTVEGMFVRLIGAGKFIDCRPCSVAVHEDVIAVGGVVTAETGHPVSLIHWESGVVMAHFGAVMRTSYTGIRFTPDGAYVIAAEKRGGHLSVFTSAGVFVRGVGEDLLGGGVQDVVMSVAGEFVVTDCFSNRVCVFSPDGSALVRSWGSEGTGEGQFTFPFAVAAAGRHLYVANMRNGRVQVFE